MERHLINTELVLDLINAFSKALIKNKRSRKNAEILIYYHTEKINYTIANLLNRPGKAYNFYENKLFARRAGSDYFNLEYVNNIPLEEIMTSEQVVEIINLFTNVFKTNFFNKAVAEALLSDLEAINEAVDGLFEMDPAFNLFEYMMFTRNLPLNDFKEYPLSGGKIIICTNHKLCESYGVKIGSKVQINSMTNTRDVIIGVAPSPHSNNNEIVIWLKNDSNEINRVGYLTLSGLQPLVIINE
ncbi:MAG: hypothetical protein WCK37_03280 [Candidatus Falkowbacteria bacterium]